MTDMTDMTEELPSPVPRGISAGEERSELYVLCYKSLPEHRKLNRSVGGNEWRGLDIDKIANEIGISTQKVSFWMQQNRVPGQRISAMIALDGSKLTYETLGPFINTR
jgi:hypothetical protein